MTVTATPTPSPPLRNAGNANGPSISRRRGLPTGRAVVGGLLVALAAIGLFTAYRQAVGEPDTAYVVMNHEIEAGERIGADDIRTEPITLPEESSPTVFSSAQSVVGAVAINQLSPGQVLQRSDVLLLAPGEEADDAPGRELSFTIASARAVDGQIRPGERVDLIATYSVSSENETVVVVRDAPVLRISEASDGLLATTGGLVMTVAIDDPRSVLAAVNAVDDADELTVVRATKSAEGNLPDSFRFDLDRSGTGDIGESNG